MNLNVLDFLIGILATWRLSSLLVIERGPYDIFGKLRDMVGITYDEASQPQGTNELAKALLCVWCTSVWVGLAVALIQRQNLLTALAYSAGAISLHKVNHG